MASSTDTKPSSSRDLVVTRLFDAPRELVWKAWTEPERLKQWWGPENFTAPVIKMDFRIGGSYHFCMRSPEGEDFWSTGVVLEIIPLERIVFTDSFADENGKVVPGTYYGMSPDFPLERNVYVIFAEEDGKTRMTLHTNVPSGEMKDLEEAGWNGSFDKLAQSLK